jgi:hypothetical protein
MPCAAENSCFRLTFQQFLKKLVLLFMTNKVSPLIAVLLPKRIDNQLAKKFHFMWNQIIYFQFRFQTTPSSLPKPDEGVKIFRYGTTAMEQRYDKQEIRL